MEINPSQLDPTGQSSPAAGSAAVHTTAFHRVGGAGEVVPERGKAGGTGEPSLAGILSIIPVQEISMSTQGTLDGPKRAPLSASRRAPLLDATAPADSSAMDTEATETVAIRSTESATDVIMTESNSVSSDPLLAGFEPLDHFTTAVVGGVFASVEGQTPAPPPGVGFVWRERDRIVVFRSTQDYIEWASGALLTQRPRRGHFLLKEGIRDTLFTVRFRIVPSTSLVDQARKLAASFNAPPVHVEQGTLKNAAYAWLDMVWQETSHVPCGAELDWEFSVVPANLHVRNFSIRYSGLWAGHATTFCKVLHDDWMSSAELAGIRPTLRLVHSWGLGVEVSLQVLLQDESQVEKVVRWVESRHPLGGSMSVTDKTPTMPTSPNAHPSLREKAQVPLTSHGMTREKRSKAPISSAPRQLAEPTPRNRQVKHRDGIVGEKRACDGTIITAPQPNVVAENKHVEVHRKNARPARKVHTTRSPTAARRTTPAKADTLESPTERNAHSGSPHAALRDIVEKHNHVRIRPKSYTDADGFTTPAITSRPASTVPKAIPLNLSNRFDVLAADPQSTDMSMVTESTNTTADGGPVEPPKHLARHD